MQHVCMYVPVEKCRKLPDILYLLLYRQASGSTERTMRIIITGKETKTPPGSSVENMIEAPSVSGMLIIYTSEVLF